MEKKKRVLVVDDEPDLALSYKIILENEGFEVHDFTNPLLALSDFKPDFYGLLVLDIRMPCMDGIALYRKIREMDKNAKVLFLTTSVVHHKGLPKSEFSSVDDESFIHEPIENDEFIKKVNKMMGQKDD